MIVVADTGPLNYLVLIGYVDVLPVLFGRVIIPESVSAELRSARAPAVVRAWIESAPDWIQVVPVVESAQAAEEDLDPGEADAIALALSLGISRILMDDAVGRAVAERHNLEVNGTLAILRAASKRGLLDYRRALDKLFETNFRISRMLKRQILELEKSGLD